MVLASLNQGQFYTTDGSGNIALMKRHAGWRKTWQLIVPGNFGGNDYTDLLFYDPTTGEGQFYTTDGSGNIALMKRHAGWRKTWQLIVPGNFGGNDYTDLLFYDPTTGEGEFYTTDGSGNIAFLKKHTGWRKTWQLIVPGNFGGNNYTDLLFYDPTTPNTGEGEFYTTDGSGNIAFLKKHTDWRKTWKLIVPGNFGGNNYTDLLFYDPTTPNTGEGEFYTTDGSGNIAFLKKHTDWRKTWKLIVPGNFGGNDYTDLLFYDTTATSLTAPIVVTVPPANAPTIPQGFHSPFSFTPSGAPVIQWNGYTYWAYSYTDNRMAMAIVAYDAKGQIVKQWEKPGARYLTSITVDAEGKTITLTGQANLTTVLSWDELKL
jgi:glutaredoxin-related protein